MGLRSKKLISLFFGILFLSLQINCTPKKKDPLSDILTLLILQSLLSDPACTFDPNGVDPLYSDQWHLNNTGQQGGTVSEDARVVPVWNSGISGRNVNVSVVDDGLDTDHEDLSANVSRNISGTNLITDTNSPRHMFSNSAHGTAVGGVIAGRGSNQTGGRGAAPCAKLVGINILEQNTISSSDEFSAMTHRSADIHISNNSWGAPDNFGWLWPSSSLWREGIQSGLRNGRNGLGTIYLWAAGNGAIRSSCPLSDPNCQVDDSNYDGQANYYGVMAIGGIGQNGRKAAYSENGANLWAVAHTQGDNGTSYTTAITTTDASGTRGFNSGSTSGELTNNNYTRRFNGTSSATPLAAGAIALLLERYPNLSWRDVREIVAKSARKNDPLDSGWAVNGAGFNTNHKYGFGAIDTNALFTTAANHTPITVAQKVVAFTTTPNVAIPDNNGTGVTSNVVVGAGSGISNLEYVEFEFGSNHTYFPELRITLTSPSGTVSIISESHFCFTNLNTSASCQTNVSGIINFTGSQIFRFGSAKHLGENPTGTWTVRVIDNGAGDIGNINHLRLRFYGR